MRTCVATLALVLLACRSATAPTDQRAELVASRAEWQRAALASYTVTLQESCFCLMTQPVRLFVVNDSIVRAVVVQSDSSINPTYFPTVNRLFAFIDGAIGKAAMLRVTYDPALGYPTRIEYDGAVNAADDEITYTLSDLHASAPPP